MNWIRLGETYVNADHIAQFSWSKGKLYIWDDTPIADDVTDSVQIHDDETGEHYHSICRQLNIQSIAVDLPNELQEERKSENGWIKINNSADLPKPNERTGNHWINAVKECVVCVRRYREDDSYLEPEYTDYVAYALYDTRNMVWNFPGEDCAINALINGNEDDFDYGQIVTHWMP